MYISSLGLQHSSPAAPMRELWSLCAQPGSPGAGEDLMLGCSVLPCSAVVVSICPCAWPASGEKYLYFQVLALRWGSFLLSLWRGFNTSCEITFSPLMGRFFKAVIDSSLSTCFIWGRQAVSFFYTV